MTASRRDFGSLNGMLGRLGRRILPTGRLARGVTMLAGGTAAGQAVAMAASPLLTRLYSPEDFGTLAVFASALGILNVVSGLRYELAIPLPAEDEDARNILALTLAVVAGFTVLVSIVVWIAGERLANLANVPALASYLWLFPVGILVLGAYQAFNYWAIRTHAYRQIARTKLNQGLAATATQLVAGFLSLRPLGLLLGQVAGQSAGTSTLAIPAFRTGDFRPENVTTHGMRSMASRYRRFPLLSSWSALLNAAGLRLPSILFAALFGSGAAGFLALTLRVIGTPMTLVGQAIAQVYVGEVARLRTRDPSAMYPLFLRIVRKLAAVSAIPAVLLAIVAPPLFSWLFGVEWHEAGVYAQLASGMFFIQFVASPLSQTLVVLEKQHLQLAWDAARLVMVAGSMGVVWALDLGAVYAMGAYAASMIVAYAILLAMMVGVLRGARGPRGGSGPDRYPLPGASWTPGRRVVHLSSAHPALDPRVFEKECKSLLRAGYDVALIARHPRDEMVDGVAVLGIRDSSSRVGRMTVGVWRVLRRALRIRADVCHLHDPELLPIALPLRLSGARVVFDVHEFVDRQIRGKAWLPAWLRPAVATGYRILERVLLLAVDRVVLAVPHPDSVYPARKTSVVQNFPPLAEHYASAASYATRPPDFAYAGGIARGRGAIELVEAVSRFSVGREARLVMLGRFSSDAFERELRSLDGWSRTVYLGWKRPGEVAQVLQSVRAGLVTLHPSPNYVEAWPTKMFEYMAAGLPVIASDFTLWRQIVSEADCGLLVDPMDPDAIYEAMSWILDHPDEAAAMGVRGRTAVVERFNWETQESALVAVYSALAPLPNSTT